MIDKLDLLSKDELKELVRIYARNIYALDGVWFQSVEGKNGMDEAMLHDENACRFILVRRLVLSSMMDLHASSTKESLLK